MLPETDEDQQKLEEELKKLREEMKLSAGAYKKIKAVDSHIKKQDLLKSEI